MTKEDFEDFAEIRRRVEEEKELERSRERLRTVVATVAAVLAWSGIMLILGTVGAADMADERGEIYPVKKIVCQCGLGVAMITPMWRLLKEDEK